MHPREERGYSALSPNTSNPKMRGASLHMAVIGNQQVFSVTAANNRNDGRGRWKEKAEGCTLTYRGKQNGQIRKGKNRVY